MRSCLSLSAETQALTESYNGLLVLAKKTGLDSFCGLAIIPYTEVYTFHSQLQMRCITGSANREAWLKRWNEKVGQ